LGSLDHKRADALNFGSRSMSEYPIIPRLAAWRYPVCDNPGANDWRTKAWCPACMLWHFHGAGPNDGSDGFRSASCKQGRGFRALGFSEYEIINLGEAPPELREFLSDKWPPPRPRDYGLPEVP
jgi:hypothetical protein